MYWSLLITASLPASSVKGCGMFILLVSLTAGTVSGSSVIYSRPYTRFAKRDADSSQTSATMHNVTMDCEDWDSRFRAVYHCLYDLLQLTQQGYPWSPVQIPRNEQNVSDRLRDALDSLNHVCYTQDRSQRCLQEHHFRDFCLLSTDGNNLYALAAEFQFICHHRQRDENLIRLLHCLYDNRLLVMLYFHIAHRCRGIGILDEMMIREKSMYFYRLNVNPSGDLPELSPLHCLPKHVITTCIRQLIDDYCGSMTADLVQDYLLYMQDRTSKALQSAGLASDICENDIGSNYTAHIPRIPSLDRKIGFHRLLGMLAPGTALDTVFGKALLANLHTLSGKELCTTVPSYGAYMVCVMSSDGKSERTKFNIVQFAHALVMSPIFPYHGSHCNRLERFTACWNLLHEICGPKVRGFQQHATLLVDGCKIQSEMDLAGCHWQDMLLPHYIQASKVTAWPIAGQCSQSPMWLETMYHYTNITDDLERIITLLQPGVEDISRICGQHLATLVQSVLDKVRYSLHDAYKYAVLFTKAGSP